MLTFRLKSHVQDKSKESGREQTKNKQNRGREERGDMKERKKKAMKTVGRKFYVQVHQPKSKDAAIPEQGTGKRSKKEVKKSTKNKKKRKVTKLRERQIIKMSIA